MRPQKIISLRIVESDINSLWVLFLKILIFMKSMLKNIRLPKGYQVYWDFFGKYFLRIFPLTTSKIIEYAESTSREINFVSKSLNFYLSTTNWRKTPPDFSFVKQARLRRDRGCWCNVPGSSGEDGTNRRRNDPLRYTQFNTIQRSVPSIAHNRSSAYRSRFGPPPPPPLESLRWSGLRSPSSRFISRGRRRDNPEIIDIMYIM